MVLQGSVAACIKSDNNENSYIASTINDVIIIWNSATLEIIRILKCHISQTYLSKFNLPKNLYTGKKYHPIDPFKRKENPDSLITYHVTSINVDNSQQYLFAGCSYPIIIIYKLDDGCIYSILRGHNDSIKSMLVFDNILYTCSDDCTFRSWDWKEGKLISNPPILTMNSVINNLSCHEEGNGIINRINLCCSDGSIVLYDIETERVVYECQFSSYISNIVTSGSTLIVSSTNGTIPVLNLPNFYTQKVNNNNVNNTNNNNDDYKISCNSVLTSLYDELTVEQQQAINDITKTKTNIIEENEEFKSTKQPLSTPIISNRPVILYTLNHQKSVSFMVINRKRELLFTSSLDCTIKVWSLLLGSLLYTYELPEPTNGLDIMLINSDREDTESYYIYCTCKNVMIVLKIELPSQILNYNFDPKNKYYLSLIDTIQSENDIRFPKLPQLSINTTTNINTKTSLSISGLGTKKSPRKQQEYKTNISFINLYILACNTDFGLECVTSVINNPHVSQREIHSLYLYLQDNQKVDDLSRDRIFPTIPKQNKPKEYVSPRSTKYNSNILPSIILSPRRKKMVLYNEYDDGFLCYGKGIEQVKENKKKLNPSIIDMKPVLRKPPIRRTIPTIPHKTLNYNSITNHYSSNKMKYVYRKPFHLSLAPLLGSYETTDVKGPEIHKCTM